MNAEIYIHTYTFENDEPLELWSLDKSSSATYMDYCTKNQIVPQKVIDRSTRAVTQPDIDAVMAERDSIINEIAKKN